VRRREDDGQINSISIFGFSERFADLSLLDVPLEPLLPEVTLEQLEAEWEARQAAQARPPRWEEVQAAMEEAWAQEVLRRMAATVALWQAARPRRAARPSWGPGEAEPVETVEVQPLDRAGQPAGKPVSFHVDQPPCLTAEGRFLFTLSTTEKPPGEVVLCTMELVERGEVTFAAPLRPVGEGWRAEIAAEGLPAGEEEVPVPLERLRLYLGRESAVGG